MKRDRNLAAEGRLFSDGSPLVLKGLSGQSLSFFPYCCSRITQSIPYQRNIDFGTRKAYTHRPGRVINQQEHDTVNPRIQRYLTRLGNAFRRAYKGEMTLKRLYAWGEAIGSKAGDRVLEGEINEDDIRYNLLVWATGITHQLHDVGTTDYFRKHPEELEHYAKMLLGEEDAVFSFGSDPIDLKVPVKTYRIKATS